jgi:hypothetical protein
MFFIQRQELAILAPMRSDEALRLVLRHGGGLCGGSGAAIKQLQPLCKVYGAEP